MAKNIFSIALLLVAVISGASASSLMEFLGYKPQNTYDIQVKKGQQSYTQIVKLEGSETLISLQSKKCDGFRFVSYEYCKDADCKETVQTQNELAQDSKKGHGDSIVVNGQKYNYIKLEVETKDKPKKAEALTIDVKQASSNKGSGTARKLADNSVQTAANNVQSGANNASNQANNAVNEGSRRTGLSRQAVIAIVVVVIVVALLLVLGIICCCCRTVRDCLCCCCGRRGTRL